MLVDSHCHLDFPEFAPELDAVVARAKDAGVGVCVTIGTKMSGFVPVAGGGLDTRLLGMRSARADAPFS